ncbi:hypothetical protein LIER_37716 [Lithospermum erythrorhizon]|uniref:Uncharacterized protein n=1 Tax=Lithospermum erythrorhizon TaxID=34254 RepID=A0AAV3PSH3_LITER
MNMEDYLYGNELDAPLGDKADKYDDEACQKLDRRVLGVIIPHLSKNVAANVAKVTTTNGLMKALCDICEVNNASAFSALKGRMGCDKRSHMKRHYEAKGEVHVVKLTKVRHIPKIGKNLISTSQLDGGGYKTSFEDGNCKVIRGAMIIAKGQKSDRIFVGEIHVLDVLCSSREVLRSYANEAALKVRKVNELDQMGAGDRREEERNSLMTNRACRFFKVPGKKAKSEHGDCLNEGKVQRGNSNGYPGFSSIFKLVSFGDVLGLAKKVLMLGSASVGVRG